MNSLAAFGCGALAMMADGDTISTEPSLGATTASGLPLAAPIAARFTGPAEMARSPEVTVVTVSMIERPTCGLLSASFLNQPGPYRFFISIAQAPTKPLKPGWPTEARPRHLGSTRSFQLFGASSGLTFCVL